MLALNVFSLLVFLALNHLSGTLARLDGKTRTAIFRMLLSVLLAFNLVKYGLPPLIGDGLRIPVEYSTVAYFVVPLLYLSGSKRGRTWAAYSGIFAGFFYYMTMMIAGGQIYADYTPANVYLSLFCHGTLYLFGLVRLKTETFPATGRATLFLGVGLVVLNAVVSRPWSNPDGRLFIYELLDGIHVRGLMTSASWQAWAWAYYATIAVLILVSFRTFFRLNVVLRLQSPRNISATMAEHATHRSKPVSSPEQTAFYL